MLVSRQLQKDMYRRLRIKTIKGIDDYSMMGEIVGRPYTILEASSRSPYH
jgi:excinuclease UvrABC nuclease subunit